MSNRIMYIRKNLDPKDGPSIHVSFDDYTFDGPHGLIQNYCFTQRTPCHYSYILTPHFYTHQDPTKPFKLYNAYRIRAAGYWLGYSIIPVINNLNWGSSELYNGFAKLDCFKGLQPELISIIASLSNMAKTIERG